MSIYPPLKSFMCTGTHMLCCVCDVPVHTHVCTVIEELVFTSYMKSRKLEEDPLYPTSRVHPGLPSEDRHMNPQFFNFQGNLVLGMCLGML